MLYVATSSQLLRLTSTNLLDTVQAVVPDGPGTGRLDDFGQVAVDGHGNIYASSLYTGWSVYRVSPDGVATDVGYARRSGGNTAVMQVGPGGAVEADDGPSIVRVEGNQIVPSYTFGTVPGTNRFTFLDYFAIAPNGTIYADDIGLSGFAPYQQIVSVVQGHATSLWQRRTIAW